MAQLRGRIETSPSDFNKRIVLQYQTKVADGMGNFTVTWVEAATVYAAIWPTSANEMIAANALSMVVTHRIRIRWRGAVKSNWRIKFGEKYYNIISIVNPNMGNRYLDILAKEAA